MKTHVSMLLDETSSMTRAREETLEGLSAYLEGIREGEAADETTVSLITFNSNETRVRFTRVPINDAKPLTASDYRPAGSTPLIDACMKTIQATEAVVEEMPEGTQVVVVFQTDGEENVSTLYTSHQLAATVKEMTAKGWQFVFLAADMDAFNIVNRSGLGAIPATNRMGYDRRKGSKALRSAGRNVGMYASTSRANSLAFDDDQRSAAGEQDTPSALTKDKDGPPPVEHGSEHSIEDSSPVEALPIAKAVLADDIDL